MMVNCASELSISRSKADEPLEHCDDPGLNPMPLAGFALCVPIRPPDIQRNAETFTYQHKFQILGIRAHSTGEQANFAKQKDGTQGFGNLPSRNFHLLFRMRL